MFHRVLISLLLVSSAAFAGVTVSSPAAGVTTSSAVHVVAQATAASSANQITFMRIYLDHTSVYGAAVKAIDTNLTVAAGPHALTVQAWDSAGNVYKSAIDLTVQSGSVIPPTATVFSKIEDMTNWKSCDACAGAAGQGPATPHWMAQFQTTPSVDGSSAEFFIGGTNPYGAALWWRQLGPMDSATHFVYDMTFYLTDPAAVQALEFDVNQSLNGKKFIFGTECDFHGGRTWRIWDATLHWQDAGISCTGIQTAKVWHSLRWEFERTSGGKTHFIAVTVDGARRIVDRFYNPKPSSVRELNVAFQMDGKSTMIDYHVWVDKIKLSVW